MTLSNALLRSQFPSGELRETKLGEVCPTARDRFPFYFKLPWNDPISLLKWRIYARKRCVNDLTFRSLVWKMASKDVAFFAVTFGTVFEPRSTPPRPIPFFLWTDQVSVLSWLDEVFGVRCAGINKTRGIGMSWLAALLTYHKWRFVPGATIATLTKDRDLLDGPDSNSALGKIQFIHDNLPVWAKYTKDGGLVANRSAEKLAFTNAENGSVIQGFVSTSVKLRQLRFSMIFADEFAFWDRTDQDEWITSASGCTNCMVVCSTWNSFDDLFHYIMYEEESSLLKIHAFWHANPERFKGAYKIEGGRVTFIDRDYKHPPNYKFGEPSIVPEGLLRSPWVDSELAKPGKNRSPLTALRDIYGMTVCDQTNSFFSADVRAAVKESVMQPTTQGVLDLSKGKVVIAPTLKSDIRIWADVPRVDRGPYVLGCDLAFGAEAAFSVCQVIDKGGDQVLEYGRNDVKLTDFAYAVVMIARWLAGDNGDGHVLIDFEANGAPKAFMAELQRLGYMNIHRSEYRHPRRVPVGEVPRYFGSTNRDAGNSNFKELERAILTMDTRIRSEKILDEMRLFSRDPHTGHPRFPRGRTGHGDFTYAYALTWWRARCMSSPEHRTELDSGEKTVPTAVWCDPWCGERQLWSSNLLEV